MRSSTSSSDAPVQRWGLAWVLALGIAMALVGTVERHWRALGYRPNVRDSAQLWSIERDRAYATDKTPLLLLGASRIEFSIDLKLMRDLLPRYQPVMLAQNAHYPLAALRDLARDERFNGVVLCDIEAGGLEKTYTDMQQPLVDYYHKQWAPSWHLHRLLLSHWQHHWAVADPDLGLTARVLRLIDGSAPPRPEYSASTPIAAATSTTPKSTSPRPGGISAKCWRIPSNCMPTSRPSSGAPILHKYTNGQGASRRAAAR